MFITLEGTEGVGKTTLIRHLEHYLQQQGKTVISTREPGGTPLAEKIRDVVLEVHDEKISPDSELLLMYASRLQHLAEKISPALAQGHIVLCDRFIDASFAYQGFGRGLDIEKIIFLNNHFVQHRPNLTLWLDAPVEIGLERAKQRGKFDRFEQENIDFFQKVQAGYQYLQQHEPERIKRIDATLSEQAVLEQALNYVRALK